MTNAFVSGDATAPEFAMFSKWQQSCEQLYQEFELFDPPLSPFAGNETSCVSVLAAAAGRAGFTPIAEAILEKHALDDKGVLSKYNGRSDLMMLALGYRYAFEFKISWPDSSDEQLKISLAQALDDIACVRGAEHYRRFAGIVAPFSNNDVFARYQRFQPHQFAFFATDAARHTGAYFFFQPSRGI